MASARGMKEKGTLSTCGLFPLYWRDSCLILYRPIEGDSYRLATMEPENRTSWLAHMQPKDSAVNHEDSKEPSEKVYCSRGIRNQAATHLRADAHQSGPILRPTQVRLLVATAEREHLVPLFLYVQWGLPRMVHSGTCGSVLPCLHHDASFT